SVSMILVCFFFQAEDGIRDFHVTGVQTCALPIYPDFSDILLQILDDGRLTDNKGRTISFKNTIILLTSNSKNIEYDFKPEVLGRSEERRVGKECRWGSLWTV